MHSRYISQLHIWRSHIFYLYNQIYNLERQADIYLLTRIQRHTHTKKKKKRKRANQSINLSIYPFYSNFKLQTPKFNMIFTTLQSNAIVSYLYLLLSTRYSTTFFLSLLIIYTHYPAIFPSNKSRVSKRRQVRYLVDKYHSITHFLLLLLLSPHHPNSLLPPSYPHILPSKIIPSKHKPKHKPKPLILTHSSPPIHHSTIPPSMIHNP